MGYINTVKTISSKTEFAGDYWYYDFKEIHHWLEEDICKKRRLDLFSEYSKLTKIWNSEKNSEWLCRIYMSSKMILSATLTLQSLDFSNEKNLRVVIPYLEYYSVLSAMRSLIFTLPTEEWKNGEIFNMNHSKIINLTCSYIAKFDKNLAEKIKKDIIRLKAQRELISYRAPTSGDNKCHKNIDSLEICKLIVEIAQFNSEILEKSIHKNSSQKYFEFKDEYINKLSDISVGDINFFDIEDNYRLNYLKRKWPIPTNILHIMTEGHTEDFFGAWDPLEEDEDSELFSTGSSSSWQMIFDIP